MPRFAPALLFATLAFTQVAEASPTLVRAAPTTGTTVWSPRRLFNAALAAEENGGSVEAVRLYLAARLAPRKSYADQMYAKGAGLRLVRILAGYDDDAATAAAMLVDDEARRSGYTDLAPLIRSLVRRMEDPEADLQIVRGRIDAVRYRPADDAAVVRLRLRDGSLRVFAAHGPVGPFSAGDQIRALVRREQFGQWAHWRLVSLSYAGDDGWGLLAVDNLPRSNGQAQALRRGRR
ncbi:MAG: hypothetical protein RIT81_15745 [Deltaproteobacteria bacterium]